VSVDSRRAIAQVDEKRKDPDPTPREWLNMGDPRWLSIPDPGGSV